jgi:NAD(P)-dependent dehydrogenase (short-subunit alcohol dehydrogenase family)
MSYLKGKTVYLTGASKGIGRAMAIRLAIDGAVLAICGRDRKALDDVESEILKQGAPRPFIGTFDLREEKEILHFYRGAREQLGAPDMLINNAGYNFRKVPLWEVGTEDFDNMLSVNLRAPFIIMREAFPDMKKKGSGHIVNILSTVCLFDNENMSVYTAAKKGFEGLTNVFRKEARPFNIRVTSIYPGGVDTGFRAKPRHDYMNPASVAEAIAGVLNAPEDVVVHHFTFRPMVETNF